MWYQYALIAPYMHASVYLAPNSAANMQALDIWNQSRQYKCNDPTEQLALQCLMRHDSCLCGLQQALNVTDRVYSVSSDTVAPCGQLQVACTQIAPAAEMLNDTDYLDTELLPYVDGIITSTPNASISPLFAFSASTDPGSLFLLPETSP